MKNKKVKWKKIKYEREREKERKGKEKNEKKVEKGLYSNYKYGKSGYTNDLMSCCFL